MAQKWMETEFERTRLPKSALAGYLGVDNGAITRVIKGERALSIAEEALTRGFFSVIPHGAGEPYKEAVLRLRTTKVKDAVSLTLASWMLATTDFSADLACGDPDAEAFSAIVVNVAEKRYSFRADQIVALSRVLEIDLPDLVAGNGVHSRNLGTGIESSIARLAKFEATTIHWAPPGAAPYKLDRAFEVSSPRTSDTRLNWIVLPPATPDPDGLTQCTPYLILDNSNAPRFEKGQTIYIDEFSEPRRGDYVAIFQVSPRTDAKKALLGKLLYEGRDTVAVNSGRRGKNEIERGQISSMRRVVYCKF
ncbi:hypothetical protein [Tardiphaga sp.]|uniref:hypothetical protein n=1 Tax=Tardiphaga sp. TaxID=1926292 RepID=UPI0037DA1E6A